MPIVQNCSDEELSGAIRAHEERLGEILLEAREQIKALDTQAAALEAQFVEPFKVILDQLLAPPGITSDELIDLAGFQSGETQDELEQDIRNFGLSVVNGRIIVTRGGDVSVSALKVLHKLVGSMAVIRSLLPELGNCNTNGDLTLKFKTKFILVVTAPKVVVIPPTDCKPETYVVSEEVLGIDVPINQILSNRTDLTRSDLTLYFFWFGEPEATPRMKNKALSLDLTEEEYFDAVLLTGNEVFQVYEITNPYKQICELDTFFGDDVDQVIALAFENRETVTVDPTDQAILDEIEASGILEANPGRTNEKGLTDFGIPALLLPSTVDFEKTFGSNKKKNKCLEASASLDFMEEFLNGVTAAANVFNSLLMEGVRKYTKLLNKITSKVSAFGVLINNLLNCLFSAGAKFSVNSPMFNGLLNLIQNGLNLFEGFFVGLDSLLNILQNLACIRISMAGLVPTEVASRLPGLECIANEFGFDFCFKVALDTQAIEAGLAFDAIAGALGGIRGALSFFLSLAFSLPRQVQNSNCLTPETAVLVSKLALRSAAAQAGISI